MGLESGPSGGGGPDAYPVCLVEAEAGGSNQYTLSGTRRELDGSLGADEPDKWLNSVVVAVSMPAETWGPLEQVELLGLTLTSGSAFELSFSTDRASVHICGLGGFSSLANPGYMSYLGFAGCEEVVVPDGDSTVVRTDLRLPLRPLPRVVEAISLTRHSEAASWSGLSRRTVQGRVRVSDGGSIPSYLVIASSSPIIDEKDSENVPASLAVVESDGLFEVSYLAPPEQPLVVCAVGMPAAGESILELEELVGLGCVDVAVPAATANGLVQVTGVEVEVDRSRTVSLALEHEPRHFDFLHRCLPKHR